MFCTPEQCLFSLEEKFFLQKLHLFFITHSSEREGSCHLSVEMIIQSSPFFLSALGKANLFHLNCLCDILSPAAALSLPSLASAPPSDAIVSCLTLRCSITKSASSVYSLNFSIYPFPLPIYESIRLGGKYREEEKCRSSLSSTPNAPSAESPSTPLKKWLPVVTSGTSSASSAVSFYHFSLFLVYVICQRDF